MGLCATPCWWPPHPFRAGNAANATRMQKDTTGQLAQGSPPAPSSYRDLAGELHDTVLFSSILCALKSVYKDAPWGLFSSILCALKSVYKDAPWGGYCRAILVERCAQCHIVRGVLVKGGQHGTTSNLTLLAFVQWKGCDGGSNRKMFVSVLQS
jgi:hypothetical protein